MNENTNAILDIIAGVLIRCFAMGLVCLTVWGVAIMLAADWAYQMHSMFFSITEEQFALVHYRGLITTKVGVFGLFLLPYTGIKMVQKKHKG